MRDSSAIGGRVANQATAGVLGELGESVVRHRASLANGDERAVEIGLIA